MAEWGGILAGMTQIPDENFSPEWSNDRRRPVPRTGSELEILTGFLDNHRTIFEQKCEGLSADELSRRGVRPSTMSLHGLVRHLAGVERWWFQIQFAGHDVPMLHYSDDDPNQDFDSLDGDVQEAFAVWRRECERSREIVAAAASLDVTGSAIRDGAPFSLRWLLVDMIAEYAQHNGHTDLLRESIDGATGV
jgi:uncharacterized protein DUF664